MRAFILSLSLLTSCSSSPSDSEVPPPEGATEEGLLVAFLGDQGVGPTSAAVLEHIRSKGTHLVVHAGDFDYVDDPAAWDAQIQSALGSDIPYLAAIGNHDVKEWPGYQDAIIARNAGLEGLVCEGIVGVRWSCTYKGLRILVGSPGLGTGGASFLKAELERDAHLWRVCAWHLNQRDMQVGDKQDEAGWGPYQSCVEGGGLIVTGHEHSYARTKTLTDPGNEAAAHGATGPDEIGTIGPGKSVVIVNGLGGQSRRDYSAELHDDDTWWAGIYAGGRHLSNGVEHTDTPYSDGTFYVRFFVDGDPRKAEGWFETPDGLVIDRVTLVSENP